MLSCKAVQACPDSIGTGRGGLVVSCWALQGEDSTGKGIFAAVNGSTSTCQQGGLSDPTQPGEGARHPADLSSA